MMEPSLAMTTTLHIHNLLLLSESQSTQPTTTNTTNTNTTVLSLLDSFIDLSNSRITTPVSPLLAAWITLLYQISINNNNNNNNNSNISAISSTSNSNSATVFNIGVLLPTTHAPSSPISTDDDTTLLNLPINIKKGGKEGFASLAERVESQLQKVFYAYQEALGQLNTAAAATTLPRRLFSEPNPPSLGGVSNSASSSDAIEYRHPPHSSSRSTALTSSPPTAALVTSPISPPASPISPNINNDSIHAVQHHPSSFPSRSFSSPPSSTSPLSSNTKNRHNYSHQHDDMDLLFGVRLDISEEKWVPIPSGTLAQILSRNYSYDHPTSTDAAPDATSSSTQLPSTTSVSLLAMQIDLPIGGVYVTRNHRESDNESAKDRRQKEKELKRMMHRFKVILECGLKEPYRVPISQLGADIQIFLEEGDNESRAENEEEEEEDIAVHVGSMSVKKAKSALSIVIPNPPLVSPSESSLDVPEISRSRNEEGDESKESELNFAEEVERTVQPAFAPNSNMELNANLRRGVAVRGGGVDDVSASSASSSFLENPLSSAYFSARAPPASISAAEASTSTAKVQEQREILLEPSTASSNLGTLETAREELSEMTKEIKKIAFVEDDEEDGETSVSFASLSVFGESEMEERIRRVEQLVSTPVLDERGGDQDDDGGGGGGGMATPTPKSISMLLNPANDMGNARNVGDNSDIDGDAGERRDNITTPVQKYIPTTRIMTTASTPTPIRTPTLASNPRLETATPPTSASMYTPKYKQPLLSFNSGLHVYSSASSSSSGSSSPSRLSSNPTSPTSPISPPMSPFSSGSPNIRFFNETRSPYQQLHHQQQQQQPKRMKTISSSSAGSGPAFQRQIHSQPPSNRIYANSLGKLSRLVSLNSSTNPKYMLTYFSFECDIHVTP
jgi:hypothetical protein